MNTNDLEQSFMRALGEAGAERSGEALFDELLTRHGEAHRRYHTILHVDDACLGYLDWYRGSAGHPERVELALWFHDAVYDPRASDNERQSAQLARARLAELGLPHAVVDDIEAHVLATARHSHGLPDTDLVVDLDLRDRAERGGRNLFDEIEEGIRSVSRRALSSASWTIELGLH